MNDKLRPSNELKIKPYTESRSLSPEDKEALDKRASDLGRAAQEEVIKDSLEHEVAIQKENNDKARKIISTQLTNQFVTELAGEAKVMMERSSKFNSDIGASVDVHETEMMALIRARKDELDREVEAGLTTASDAKMRLERFIERQEKKFQRSEGLADIAMDAVIGLYKTGFENVKVAKRHISND